VSSIAGAPVLVDRPPDQRLRQGAVLLAGALGLGLVLGDDPWRFLLVPIGLGVVYLLAGAILAFAPQVGASPRRGPLRWRSGSSGW